MTAPMPPVIVPLQHRDEMRELTQTELMDLCWWVCAARGSILTSTLEEFRLHRDRVMAIRDQELRHKRKRMRKTLIQRSA